MHHRSGPVPRTHACPTAARRVACVPHRSATCRVCAVRSHLLQLCGRTSRRTAEEENEPVCSTLTQRARLQLDGHVIEQCIQAGDGQFKEGAWVKISEEYQNHPELQQLSKFVGKYGRLTRRYHGCAVPRKN